MATANAAAFWTALGTTRGHEVVRTPGYLAVLSSTRFGSRILMLSPSPSTPDVEAVRDLARGRNGVFMTVEDPFAVVDLPGLGLEPRPMPVMSRMPRRIDTSIEWDVARVVTVDELRTAEHVIVHGFPLTRVQPYEPGETLPDALLDYPGFEVFLISRDGTTAGACVTMTAAACTGVYWVTTLPEHRSKGVARALMLAILEHHAERPVTLDASAAGKPLYDSLGFDVVSMSTWWT